MSSRNLFFSVILLSVYFAPYLNFYQQNLEQLALADTYQILYSLTALLLLNFFLIYAAKWFPDFITDLTWVASIIAAYVFFKFYVVYPYFVNASNFFDLSTAKYLFLASLILLILMSLHLIRFRLLKIFLLVFFASGLLLPCIKIAQIKFTTSFDGSIAFSSDVDFFVNGEITKSSGENVYLIIPDGYASNHVLLDQYNFDNTEFYKFLAEQDFYITNSKSNYLMTFMTMASIFKVDYPVLTGDNLFSDRSSFYPSVLTSAVAPNLPQILNSLNYELVLVGNSWSGCADQHINCFKPQPIFNPSSYAFLQSTILSSYLSKYEESFTLGYDAITPFLGGYRGLLNHGKSKFFVLHHFPPHPPHIFDEFCSPGSGSTEWGPAEDYVKSILCVNLMIENLVNDILVKDPNSIIVIMSDHGPSVDLKWEESIANWSDAQINIRAGIINAIKAPGECKKFFRDDLAQINTIRFVLACIARLEPNYVDEFVVLTTYEKNPDYGSAFIWDPASVKR
jgi:hypothetical protein